MSEQPLTDHSLVENIDAGEGLSTSSEDKEIIWKSTVKITGAQGNATPLCVHCKNWCDVMALDDFHPNVQHPFWDDIFQLERSVAAGCTMCSQFLQSGSSHEIQQAKVFTQEFQTGHGDLFSRTESRHARGQMRFHLTFIFSASPKAAMERIVVLGVCLVPVGESNSLWNTDGRLNQNTKRALPQISRWLRDCRETHEKCNHSRERIVPTRLVSTERGSTRLFMHDDFDVAPEYATLSHCWGKKKFVTLEKQNLSTFKQKIPDEALSKTFKDAIETARELGIQYIWIDSLCIIQDDNDDWIREAATMSSIYGDSNLNIAATGAADGSYGCFLQTSSCLVQIHSRKYFGCFPWPMYDRHLSDMCLMKRGWALQERLLPSRTVHFTLAQVFWECHQTVACEIFLDGITNDYLISPLQKQPISFGQWHSIVENYTRSELTQAADKLVALSGIAREIQKQTQDQYVAGIWRSDLELGLCWITCGEYGHRVTPYRAPTWSWASIEGPIGYSYRPPVMNMHVKVLDVQIQYIGIDPLGQISSGILRLSCSNLLPVHVSLRKIYGERYVFAMSGRYKMTLAGREFEVWVSQDELENLLDLYDGVVLPFYDSPEDGVGGLILEPNEKQKGQYRRVGHFSMQPAWIQEFKEASRPCWLDDKEVVERRIDEFGKIQDIIDLV